MNFSAFDVIIIIKPIFHLATLFARTDKKVGTLPTCSRRIFSPASFNQSCCRILVFASRRANKVAKWKIGLRKVNCLNLKSRVESQNLEGWCGIISRYAGFLIRVFRKKLRNLGSVYICGSPSFISRSDAQNGHDIIFNLSKYSIGHFILCRNQNCVVAFSELVQEKFSSKQFTLGRPK